MALPHLQAWLKKQDLAGRHCKQRHELGSVQHGQGCEMQVRLASSGALQATLTSSSRSLKACTSCSWLRAAAAFCSCIGR